MPISKKAVGRRDAIVAYLESSLGAHAGGRFSR
jgi:hypothetical protein